MKIELVNKYLFWKEIKIFTVIKKNYQRSKDLQNHFN